MVSILTGLVVLGSVAAGDNIVWGTAVTLLTVIWGTIFG
jgi:hypothetical protein